MIGFEFEVNTGSTMHVIETATLGTEEVQALTRGGDLGIESGMGALAVAQRIAYLHSELASQHHAALNRPVEDGEPDQTEVHRRDALALAQSAILLDLLVKHFNTMVVISRD